MLNINVEIKLCEFKELTEVARNKVINEQMIFLCEMGDYEEETVTEDDIISSIECNEYLFFETGELADITHYCGKHEKAGITEFKFMNEVYTI